MSAPLPVVAPKAHATLGASSASRWMACPGSVRLSRGIPNVDSEYAREGTAAHALAELALRKGVDPDMWLGLEVEGVEVTEDMVDNVRVFVDYAQGIASKATSHWIERKFSLAAFNPPEPMFGTADFVAYNGMTRELEVVDLKFGQGVVVEAVGNKQLRYYALGAALSLSDYAIDRVTMTIVQPRVSHVDGVIRSETIDILDLLAFSGELLDAARATLDPNAPLVPGPHCRFCPASGVCPAQFQRAQELAQMEFSELSAAPPAPDALSNEELGRIARNAGQVEDYLKAMWAQVKGRLERGETVPGYKLVEKRATRKWTSEEQTRRWLEGKGYDPEEIEDRKIKSPAQIEKVMGKQKKELPVELITKTSSGYTLAADHDPRPEVTVTQGEEFAALPAADE